MKNVFYLVLILILSNITTLNAQVPISLTYGGNDVTNSEILLEREVEMHIHVTNNGASDMDIIVEVTDVNIPSKEPVMLVCWGSCFPVTGPIVLGTVNVKAGETNTTDFHITYNSDGNTGPADIFFHVYEDGGSGGYITFGLDTEYTGVNDIDKKEYISIYPNPATTFFNIKVSEELSDSKIIITNIIGKLIKTINVQRSDNRFSAGELLKGIYFVSLIKDKKVLTTKKLIVN